MKQIEKTVFISYRRSDKSWALLIYKDLTHQGYDVFIDYTGLASGDFAHAIFENINARAHFLVLLSPSTLERCGKPDDLLRREIETALDSQRNIVPLMLEGFDFNTPDIAKHLTGKLAALQQYNALTVPADYFDEAMGRLHYKYLNVRLDAVLHPTSVTAQQTAKKEQAAARIASEKAPNDISRLYEVETETLKKSESEEFDLNKDKKTQNKASNVDKTAAQKTLTCPVSGIEMVKIPSGCFMMGSPASEVNRYNNEEQHEVCIKQDFYLGKYVVTQGQWQAIMGSNPSGFKKEDNYPVENVSWNQVQDFIRKLNDKTGQHYRLPSEAEWEYAARAGTATKYWWGNKINQDDKVWANCVGCGSQWDGEQTAPVDSFKPNLFGLYNTTGNVWEWVQDCYSQSYKDEPTDGTARESTDNDNCTRRVLRGGSWLGDPGSLRWAYRYGGAPTVRFNDIGFRLAQDL